MWLNLQMDKCFYSSSHLLGPGGGGEAGVLAIVLADGHAAGQNLLAEVEGEDWQQHPRRVSSRVTCQEAHRVLGIGKYILRSAHENYCFGIYPV